MKIGRYLVTTLLFASLVLGVQACGKKPLPDSKPVQVKNAKASVEAVGYGWGENAKETAKANAVYEATALSVPRSIEFTHLFVPPYSMFKTEQMNEAEFEVIEEKPLPDGGYMVRVAAKRDYQALKDMRFMRALNFELKCKGETFKERLQSCNHQMYEKSMKVWAMRNFETLPEKLMGNFTFFEINREDNGKNRLDVEVTVTVGLKSPGKLGEREKAMVLKNAWRHAAKSGNALQSQEIFRRAMNIFKDAEFAKEYGLYEFRNGRYENAIRAMKLAQKVNPHGLEPLKILYQIYKKTGEETKMAAVEKKLRELESWEENPGADLTGSLHYKQEIKWSEGGDEKEPTGKIHFREVDETEMEELEQKEE